MMEDKPIWKAKEYVKEKYNLQPVEWHKDSYGVVSYRLINKENNVVCLLASPYMWFDSRGTKKSLSKNIVDYCASENCLLWIYFDKEKKIYSMSAKAVISKFGDMIHEYNGQVMYGPVYLKEVNAANIDPFRKPN